MKRAGKALKLATFVGSVIALSWFFAGWRQINESGGLSDWALLLFGTASTAALIALQGFWIYFEEKDKGRLVRRVELFERVNSWLELREAK